MIRRICFFLILLLLASMSFAGAGFYEDAGANQYEKAVFDFGGGFQWKRLATEVDGQYYGHKGASDTWLLNGGEAFVWKDNGSDITSVTQHYRIYKDGQTPPAFSDINVAWDSNVGGNNQRWATTSENIDIIAAANSAGRWYVEFYYSATTNSVDCDPVVYFSNSGANYTLYFDHDVISVVLTSFSALLQSDGMVVELDGTTQEIGLDAAPGNYYIYVQHRNHLAAMSATTTALSSNSATLYDFTADVNSYYGTDAALVDSVPANVYGMYAGDANGNNQVQNDDKNDFWKIQAGNAGYLSADFNVNGQVQNNDKNDLWKENVGKGSQAP